MSHFILKVFSLAKLTSRQQQQRAASVEKTRVGHPSLFLTCPFCYGAVVRHLLVKRLTIKPLMKMGEPTIPAGTADSSE